MSAFHDVLKKMGRGHSFIDLEGSSLVCASQPPAGKTPVEKKVQAVLKYIQSHQEELRKSDLPALRDLEVKLFQETQQMPALQKTVQQAFQDFQDKAQNNQPLKKSKSVQDESILFRLSPAPIDAESFLKNMKLVGEHYPRYQFGNDLAVYDTHLGKCPPDTDVKVIRTRLKEQGEAYEKATDDPTTALKPALKESVEGMRHILKPMKAVQLALIIEKSVGGDNGAMKINLESCVNNNIPVLMTKSLLHCYPSEFKILLSKSDLYVQEKGSLILVLPKGAKPAEFGFRDDTQLNDTEKQERLNQSQDYFVKWMGPLSNIPKCDVEVNKPISGNIAVDLQHALLEDQEEEGFYRLAIICGHGSYPGYSSELKEHPKGDIAGLPVHNFQACLESLAKRNLAFVSMRSCYVGGTNSKDIHLPNGAIPCPIYIESITESVTFSITEDTLNSRGSHRNMLNKAQKKLFKDKTNHPKSLSHVDMLAIARASPNADKHMISNLGMALFPTLPVHPPQAKAASSEKDAALIAAQRGAQPKPVYIVPALYHVWNLHEPVKGMEAKVLEAVLNKKPIPSKEIVDKSLAKTVYICSDPVIPLKIVRQSPGPFALLSRGGHAHHVIAEIEAPHISLEDIAERTFNLTAKESSKEVTEPANKVFAIGKMRCLYEGKLRDLENVVIQKTNTVCQVSFKITGETQYLNLNFKKTAGGGTKKTQWTRESAAAILTPTQALHYIYSALYGSIPYQASLKNLSGMMASDRYFFECLDDLFWNGLPPKGAELYRALIHSYPLFRRPAGEAKVSPKELIQSELFQEVLDGLEQTVPKDLERTYLLKCAYIFAKNRSLKTEMEKIYHKSLSPLMKAVEENRNDELEGLVADKQNLYNSNVNGDTALHLAVKKGNVQAIGMLLKAGVLTSLSNDERKTPLDLAIESKKLDLIAPFLQYGILSDHQQSVLWNHAIDNDDKDLAKLLLSKNVGMASTFSPLILALNKKNFDIARLILEHPLLNLRDEHNKRAVFFAIGTGCFDLIPEMIAKDIDLTHKEAKGGLTAAHYAIGFGKESEQLANLKLFLEKIDINIQDKIGNTLLHTAVLRFSENILAFLLKEGAMTGITNIAGSTPADLACEKGYDAILTRLLDSGIPIEGEEGHHLLEVAIQNDRPSTVKLLLERKAGIKTGKSLLIEAAKSNNKQILELLLADRKYPVADKQTALNTALSMNASHQIVELLLNDPDLDSMVLNRLDQNRNTPLHLAVQNRHLSVIPLLVAKGCNLNARDADHKTPMDIAIDKKDGQMVLKLLDQGARMTEQQAARSLIQEINENPNSTYLRAVCGYQVPMTGVDEDGNTVLHHALNLPLSLFSLILRSGGSSDVANRAGKTPLQEALAQIKLEVVRVLLHNGASISPEDGKVALFLAAKDGDLDLVKLLFARKVEIDAADEKGNTPLHLAIQNHKGGVAQYLTNKGANLDQANSDGKTPRNTLEGQEGYQMLKNALMAEDLKFAEWLLKFQAGKNHPQSVLIDAVSWGKTDIVDFLLKHGKFDINMLEEEENQAQTQLQNVMMLLGTVERARTPLQSAIMAKDVQMVQFLLKKGADPHFKIPNGKSTLLIAVESVCHHQWMGPNKKPNLEILKALVDKVKTLDEGKGQPNTLLEVALSSQNVEFIDFLVSHGSRLDVPIGKDWNNALEYVLDYNGAVLPYVLERATPEMLNTYDKGKTAFHLLVMRYPEHIQAAIQKGAKVDLLTIEDWNPLQLLYAEHHKLIKEKGYDKPLLDRGLHWDIQAAEPLLLYGIQKGDLHLLRFLLDSFPDLLAWQDEKGNTLGHHLFINTNDEWLYPILALILAKGISIDIPNIKNETVRDLFKTPKGMKFLNQAIDFEELEAVKHFLPLAVTATEAKDLRFKLISNLDLFKLLEAQFPNYSADETNAKGKTLLHVAMDQASPESADHLVAKGDPNIVDVNSNQNILHKAMLYHPKYRHAAAKLVQRIVDQMTDLNAQDKEGNTALHLAIRENFIEVIDLLVEKGVRLNLLNDEGETAWQLIKER